jgi:hypothetical protein
MLQGGLPVSTSPKDLVASYGHTLDFDRLLATPRTILICWAVAALLLMAAGLPVTIDTTRWLGCGIAPQCDRLAHPPGQPNLSTTAVRYRNPPR